MSYRCSRRIGLFNIEDLRAVLSKTKQNKAPKMNRILYDFYKEALIEFLTLLIEYSNKILAIGDVSDALRNPVFPRYIIGMLPL